MVPVPSARDSGFFLCDIEAVLLGIYFLTRIRLNKPHLLSFCYAERLKLVPLLRLVERRYDVRRVKFAIPWRIPQLLLRVAEALIGKSKVRADSMVDFAYPATVADRATFTDPFQYAVGISTVIVNGKVVLDNGRHTGARPGVVIKGHGV